MNRVCITLVAAALALPGAAIADSANWSAEKAAQVDQNRNSDSGRGNGGERRRNNGTWTETNAGEEGRRDLDPGNSGNQCQGGKNAKTGGC